MTNGLQEKTEKLMSTQPTAEDAKLIMRLYELRRESEMRKARTWFASFFPLNADDLVQIMKSGSTQENAWFRQVSGYWDMAASFVLQGALNEDLFFDSGGEMWFTLAKVYPFLQEAREKAQSPYYMARIEKLATRTDAGRERLQMMLKRVEAMRAAGDKAA
jgi:hypothetical protein